MVPSDMVEARRKWQTRGDALLSAKKYDEIEQICAELERKNVVLPSGYGASSLFFDPMSEGGDEIGGQSWNRQLQKLKDWQKARPHSVYAPIALASFWVSWAWKERGGEYAYKVEAKSWAIVHERLDHAANLLANAPMKSRQSLQWFRTFLSYGQLASLPTQEMKQIFDEGMRHSPHDFYLIRQWAVVRLPQWGGKAGEWQSFIAQQADAVGGEKGDILYAQLMVSMKNDFIAKKPWKELGISWPRTKKGLEALCRQNPNSVALQTVLMDNAHDAGDNATAQKAVLKINGRANTGRFKNASEWAHLRLDLLDAR